MNQSDCYSSGEPPLALVECLGNGVCSCQECFTINTTINRCYEENPTCYFYNSSMGQCQDERPSQAVAFYLSLCLSSVGAANFYIGRNDLGGIQLVLFISLFAVLYCVCYAMCCMFCGIAGEENSFICVSQPTYIHMYTYIHMHHSGLAEILSFFWYVLLGNYCWYHCGDPGCRMDNRCKPCNACMVDC